MMAVWTSVSRGAMSQNNDAGGTVGCQQAQPLGGATGEVTQGSKPGGRHWHLPRSLCSIPRMRLPAFLGCSISMPSHATLLFPAFPFHACSPLPPSSPATFFFSSTFVSSSAAASAQVPPPTSNHSPGLGAFSGELQLPPERRYLPHAACQGLGPPAQNEMSTLSRDFWHHCSRCSLKAPPPHAVSGAQPLANGVRQTVALG